MAFKLEKGSLFWISATDLGRTPCLYDLQKMRPTSVSDRDEDFQELADKLDGSPYLLVYQAPEDAYEKPSDDNGYYISVSTKFLVPLTYISAALVIGQTAQAYEHVVVATGPEDSEELRFLRGHAATEVPFEDAVGFAEGIPVSEVKVERYRDAIYLNAVYPLTYTISEAYRHRMSTFLGSPEDKCQVDFSNFDLSMGLLSPGFTADESEQARKDDNRRIYDRVQWKLWRELSLDRCGSTLPKWQQLDTLAKCWKKAISKMTDSTCFHLVSPEPVPMPRLVEALCLPEDLSRLVDVGVSIEDVFAV